MRRRSWSKRNGRFYQHGRPAPGDCSFGGTTCRKLVAITEFFPACMATIRRYTRFAIDRATPGDAAHARTEPALRAAQDDDLVFVGRSAGIGAPGARRRAGAWRVMIVDDDDDVHSTTTFALGSLDMQGRPLEFVHAYSARRGARACCERERDIAVILLDVVMEQADAGLHLVRHIRDTLGCTTCASSCAPASPATRPRWTPSAATTSTITAPSPNSPAPSCTPAWRRRSAPTNRSARSKTAAAAWPQVVRANAELMALHSACADVAHGMLREAAAPARPARARPAVRLPRRRRTAGGLDRCWPAAGGSAALRARPARWPRPAHEAAAAIARRRWRERRHLVERARTLTLYFRGKSARDFAAWLRAGAPARRAAPRPAGRVLQQRRGRPGQRGADDRPAARRLLRPADRAAQPHPPGRTDRRQPGRPRQRATPILCLVDLDHFAETNDALGHQFGDAAAGARWPQRLRARWPRLRACTLARIGGDIFCVLGDAAEVDPARILRACSPRPFSIDGQDVQVSATLGLVRLGEHDGSGADALKDADIALKRAKSRQRGGHFYFSRSMGVEIRERVRLMHALRSGFARGELFLAYQPQVDLAARRPFGAEALLRWRTEDGRAGPARPLHPDRRVFGPDHRDRRMGAAPGLRRTDAPARGRPPATSRCRSTSRRCSSATRTSSTCCARRWPTPARRPSCVELEITESMAMEEPDLLIESLAADQAHRRVDRDRRLRHRLFLAVLPAAPADRPPEDRPRLRDRDHRLGARQQHRRDGDRAGPQPRACRSWPKGVEDERQAQILQALGCPLAQGFLFARPLPPEALLEWLGSGCADARGVTSSPRAARRSKSPWATGLLPASQTGPPSPTQSSAACSAGQSRIYALSMRFSKLCASSTAGHVVERDHAQQGLGVHHRQVARVLFQHDAAHFVDFGVRRDGDRAVVHVLAHRAGADRAAVLACRP